MVDALNRDVGARGSVGSAPGFVPQRVVLVQIRGTDLPTAGRMECTLPGQELNPSAIVYVVDPPWTLTEAARGAVSYAYADLNNRTADGTEVQQMTPLYIIGDNLLIAEYEQTGTWRDLNIDGRQWAKVP